jgi:excisionase family DNA binding protein
LDERLISLKEAAVRSGLSTSFLRRLCRQGVIDGVKVGRDWVVTWPAVATYLEDPIKRSHDPRKNQID